MDLAEFQRELAFHQLERGVSGGGGRPTRTLHVYSDVAGSSVVDNRVTDLLREVQYKRQGRGTLYFESLHIQYMTIRNEVVEIIHVQVAETIGRGGDLVKFGDGHTIVTLHFKKT